MIASKASRSILSPSRVATSQENSVEDKVDKVVDMDSLFPLNSLNFHKSWFASTYVPPTLQRGDTYPYLVKVALNVTIVNQDLLPYFNI